MNTTSITTKIPVARNDYGFGFSWTIQDSDGNGVDLITYNAAGCGVFFKMWVPGSPQQLLAYASSAIVTASTGAITYTSLSTDFISLPGTYSAEWELIKANNRQSTQPFEVVIYESG